MGDLAVSAVGKNVRGLQEVTKHVLWRDLLAGKDDAAINNKIKFLISNGKRTPSLLRDSETSYLLLFV